MPARADMIEELAALILSTLLRIFLNIWEDVGKSRPAFRRKRDRFLVIFYDNAEFSFHSLNRKNTFLSKRIHDDNDDECDYEDGKAFYGLGLWTNQVAV